MEWITPITDRTAYDVELADVNRDKPEPNKGARNATDLNRISNNIKYIREQLISLGFLVPEMTSRSDWLVITQEILEQYNFKPPDKDTKPRISDITKCKDDVAALREIAAIFPHTPDVPDLPYMHFQKLNDIEQILYDIHTLIIRTHKSFIGSGEVGSGEV